MFFLLDLIFILLLFSFISFIFQAFTGFRRGINPSATDSLKQTQELTRRTAMFQGMSQRQEEQLNDSLSMAVCFSRFTLQVAMAEGGFTQASFTTILQFFHSASPQYLQHIQQVLLRDMNNPSSIDWDYNLTEARRILAKPEWSDFQAILFDGLLRISMADGQVKQRSLAIIFEIMGDLGWSADQTESWYQQRKRQGYSGQGSQHQGYRSQQSPRGTQSMSRTEAAQILGVQPNSTLEEIKKRYRKLVQEHHPDRYAQMGEEMQKSATTRFYAIQQAYETLTG